jgi:integrase
MATVQTRNGSSRILFLYHGKRHSFTIGEVSEKVANDQAGAVDRLLWKLKQGFAAVPPGMDIVSFVQFDGKVPEGTPTTKAGATLGSLRDAYLSAHRGSLEETTIDGIELHFRHLVRILGDGVPLKSIDQAKLQEYADGRAKMKWRKAAIRPATIKKELISLRTAWNWGIGAGLSSGRFPPLRQVRLAKADEKQPFQTKGEIERRIARGGLAKAEVKSMWECLFLQTDEIGELLTEVEKHEGPAWVHPMVCFAAYTGARRSEITRALVADIDFDGKTVLIREKKRSHDSRTTRRVPLTDRLAAVLRAWLAVHPGGQSLFAQSAQVRRSKTKRTAATAVTPDEAHDHFKRALAGSKWSCVRGWHVLRHSFISACASKGVDQRLVQEWAGHMSATMSRRYAHLYPSVQQEALRAVFD